MGNDGGSIPKRREIINFSQRKLDRGGGGGGERASGFSKDIAVSKILNQFKYCRLSGKTLQNPVVSDYLGNLYNKEDVLQYLLDKKRGKSVSSVKDFNLNSLNDLVELKIDLSHDDGTLKCLVSDVKVNINDDSNAGLPDVMFSYIVPCGCVMNSKVLHGLIDLSGKEDENSERKCPVCSTLFQAADIIDINSLDKEVREKLEKRMSRLREEGRYHNLKKVKKRKRKDTGVTEDKCAKSETETTLLVDKRRKL